jgi:hypothetical protein
MFASSVVMNPALQHSLQCGSWRWMSACQNTIVDQKCQSNWMSNVKPPRNETSAIGFESLPEDMAWFSVYHFPMFSYWCSLFIWGGVPCLVKWSVASWVPALQLVVGFPWCHL